eukprot:COSAG02_NODE_63747_length_262_cov_0.938650_1_plen_44_part_10
MLAPQSGRELHGQILTSENEAPSNSRTHSQAASVIECSAVSRIY